MRQLLYVLPFVLLSCVEQPQITLSSTNYTFYIDETQTVSGETKGDIKQVDLKVNKNKEGSTSIKNNSFSFNLSFTKVATGTLQFEGLGADGKSQAITTVNYSVVERPVAGNDERFDFGFAEPNLAKAAKHTMWATSYWLPLVQDKSTGHALRDMSGNELGPKLSLKEWCDAAMEGSILVRDNAGRLTTYNYAGTTTAHQVDCSSYFSHTPSHRVKFKVANGEYGDGVKNYKLIPYRTIAVDPTYYPYGSVIYIPAARGNVFTLPDGTTQVHDGYFFAADAGGLIKQNHIDVFRGTEKKILFSWIKSTASGTFTAYIVDEPAVKAHLESIHK